MTVRPPMLTNELSPSISSEVWEELRRAIDGELLSDPLSRMLYATDASIYEQMPAAVVWPRHREDCIAIVRFAGKHLIPLIPRAAGTSLAGQCVGAGLIVDVSRYMIKVLDEHCAGQLRRAQPGVVVQDLNDLIADTGRFFPIDPSTAEYCTVGGMIGNNAWGVHSPLFGTTRDCIEEIEAVLYDASVVRFGPLDKRELGEKLSLQTLEGEIYRRVYTLVDRNKETILEGFPNSSVLRNNCGYALDMLAGNQPWVSDGKPFNLAPFICGSEGTLVLVTEATLRLSLLPAERLLVCVHFNCLEDALDAVQQIVSLRVAAVELLDRQVLQASVGHIDQRNNRFWLQGDPAAVLIVEIATESMDELDECRTRLLRLLREATPAYAFPAFSGAQMQRVWALRRASLGLLMGKPGPARTVTAIEDCAVPIGRLSEFARCIAAVMNRQQVSCIYYGPVSVGVIHLRPELDLRSKAERERLMHILDGVADIVVALGGTMTSKHGDGWVRSHLIEKVLGSSVYRLLQEIKTVFDPKGLYNPGKIVQPLAPDQHLRAATVGSAPIKVVFNWDKDRGLEDAVNRCNGAGKCLRRAGRGLMCPSYMATRKEQDTTRGRANVLRQLLSSGKALNSLDFDRLRQVLDHCLACKGCKAECPASVDMARMKAEIRQHDFDINGIPRRLRFMAQFERISRIASKFPVLANSIARSRLSRYLFGFHRKRLLPALTLQSLSNWAGRRRPHAEAGRAGEVILFNDPFSNYYEPGPAIAAIELLEASGYRVRVSPPLSSGRLLISQGLLHQARQTLEKTLHVLESVSDSSLPIVGLEPSELLTFRDEAVDLVRGKVALASAKSVAGRALLLEEFICREHQAGRFKLPTTGSSRQELLLHGHCHQKALAGMQCTEDALKLIPNAHVSNIASGCCGMAGFFGYEAEHYELSMQIGELILFPAIRLVSAATQIVATGASCRQQIMAGTGRRAYHPAETLRNAQLMATLNNIQ